MMGTDELFPDAIEHSATPAPRRALGIAAFLLGLLALLGDLLGIVVAVVTLARAATHGDQTLSNVDNSLGAVIGVIVLELVVFIGGIVCGLLALVFGILAAIRRRGRVLGAFGAVFGLFVLITHLVLAIVISSSGNVPGVTA